MALVDESITSKIKKLLALADGNKNEHEREVAMKLAMDLLAKHNLTMTELDGSAASDAVKEFDVPFIRIEPWIKSVLNAACTLYYTDYYTMTTPVFKKDSWGFSDVSVRDVPVFIGTQENVNVTVQVATWLIDSIRIESNWRYRDTRLRRSFRLGAARQLASRAHQLVESEKFTQSTTPGTSLVVLRNKLVRANDEYLATLNLRVSKPRRPTVNLDAFAAGKAYGDTVALPARGSNQAQIGTK